MTKDLFKVYKPGQSSRRLKPSAKPEIIKPRGFLRTRAECEAWAGKMLGSERKPHRTIQEPDGQEDQVSKPLASTITDIRAIQEFRLNNKQVIIAILHVRKSRYLDILSQLKSLNQKYGTSMKLIEHKNADLLLHLRNEYEFLTDKGCERFPTNSLIAYEEPGRPLQAFLNYRSNLDTWQLGTGGHAGKLDVALVVKGITEAEFTMVRPGDLAVRIPDEQLICVHNFPQSSKEEDRFRINKRTLLPVGSPFDAPGHRHLIRRNGPYIGPIVRGYDKHDHGNFQSVIIADCDDMYELDIVVEVQKRDLVKLGVKIK